MTCKGSIGSVQGYMTTPVVDHVEAGAACRGVSHEEGQRGGVHLSRDVSRDQEHHVLTDLQTQVSSANITITGHNNFSTFFQLLLSSH